MFRLVSICLLLLTNCNAHPGARYPHPGKLPNLARCEAPKPRCA